MPRERYIPNMMGGISRMAYESERRDTSERNPADSSRTVE
jgi:hypothetical protein